MSKTDHHYLLVEALPEGGYFSSIWPVDEGTGFQHLTGRHSTLAEATVRAKFHGICVVPRGLTTAQRIVLERECQHRGVVYTKEVPNGR